jgi:predicted nucleotidyltransferase
VRYRDRDAPVTRDGLIFRTYGYDHPPDSCFCDLEYAPETLYRSDDPRALRDGLPTKYYKFYFDGGLKFATSLTPPYRLIHESLRLDLVGVEDQQLSRVVRPERKLREMLETEDDPLIEACEEILDLVTDHSSLNLGDFGVFGSLAHGFHNPKYGDIDLIIYGMRELRELRETLKSLYRCGPLRNEFEGWTPEEPPAHWNFTNYTKEEYGAAQRRKGIYTVYHSEGLDRDVKVEFEPVRRWDEISNEYGSTKKIERLGRVQAVGEVISSEEGGFMPAVYPVWLREISGDVDCRDVVRVVSFVEEFRLQLSAGEEALIKGNLERVEREDGVFHQITLSYGEDYFDQILKPVGAPR